MLEAVPGRPEGGMPLPEFRIAVHPNRSEVVIAPKGELDLFTTGTVAEQLHSLRDVGFVDIVVDLRGLTFIDSTGIRLLLQESQAARNVGARLRLVHGPDAVRRAFELTGATSLLDFIDGHRR
jgi:anti-sigma B factor antagonist